MKVEKEMVTHSSVLAWRIPGMGEPGGLLSALFAGAILSSQLYYCPLCKEKLNFIAMICHNFLISKNW